MHDISSLIPNLFKEISNIFQDKYEKEECEGHQFKKIKYNKLVNKEQNFYDYFGLREIPDIIISEVVLK